MTMMEAIKERISCRTYRDSPIELEKIEILKGRLKSDTAGPFGSRVRFDLFEFGE